MEGQVVSVVVDVHTLHFEVVVVVVEAVVVVQVVTVDLRPDSAHRSVVGHEDWLVYTNLSLLSHHVMYSMEILFLSLQRNLVENEPHWLLRKIDQKNRASLTHQLMPLLGRYSYK
jgi:hypothetical protein